MKKRYKFILIIFIAILFISGMTIGYKFMKYEQNEFKQQLEEIKQERGINLL